MVNDFLTFPQRLIVSSMCELQIECRLLAAHKQEGKMRKKKVTKSTSAPNQEPKHRTKTKNPELRTNYGIQLRDIEKKWQAQWKTSGAYKVSNDSPET